MLGYKWGFQPSGSIDCAGILKLRNADIELRKGETDIGRKNTRVRLVFRVHIPESSGRIVSLQTASNPIECCELGAGQGRSLESGVSVICHPGARCPVRILRTHTDGQWAPDDQRGQRRSTWKGSSLLLFTCGEFCGLTGN